MILGQKYLFKQVLHVLLGLTTKTVWLRLSFNHTTPYEKITILGGLGSQSWGQIDQ